LRFSVRRSETSAVASKFINPRSQLLFMEELRSPAG